MLDPFSVFFFARLSQPLKNPLTECCGPCNDILMQPQQHSSNIKVQAAVTTPNAVSSSTMPDPSVGETTSEDASSNAPTMYTASQALSQQILLRAKSTKGFVDPRNLQDDEVRH